MNSADFALFDEGDWFDDEVIVSFAGERFVDHFLFLLGDGEADGEHVGVSAAELAGDDVQVAVAVDDDFEVGLVERAREVGGDDAAVERVFEEDVVVELRVGHLHQRPLLDDAPPRLHLRLQQPVRQVELEHRLRHLEVLVGVRQQERERDVEAQRVVRREGVLLADSQRHVDQVCVRDFAEGEGRVLFLQEFYVLRQRRARPFETRLEGQDVVGEA